MSKEISLPAWARTPEGDGLGYCALPTCRALLPYKTSNGGQRHFCKFPNHQQTYVDRRAALTDLISRIDAALTLEGETTREGRRLRQRRSQLQWLLRSYSHTFN